MNALLLSLLLAQSYYSPEEAKALFDQGNEAYAREDYAAAQAAYEQLLQHGLDNKDVLYNAGTAALANKDLGHAILYLERASDRGDDSPDLEANLAVARGRQIDQVVGAGTERTFLQRLVTATDERKSALALLIFSWSGFGLLFLFRLLKPGTRSWALVLGSVLVVMAAFSGILVASHAWVAANVREAVVLAPTLPTRELPTASARTSFEMHAGLKVRLLESEGDFVKIRLPNGAEGWAERKGIADL